MSEIEQLSYDKSNWGDGPWTAEPDRTEFTHLGLPCLMVRNRMGAWCGYVGVPPGHPAHSKDYDDLDVYVHGGLTFSAACGGHICHVPAPGEPDNIWWLGFDCAHSIDFVPEMKYIEEKLMPGESMLFPEQTYRDVNYVTCQVANLAEQLKIMEIVKVTVKKALMLEGKA